MSALITELEVATANTNVRSGQIKNNSWLVDSGGGMFMSPDVTDALPGSLRILRGCSAKIGSGELCPATQIGKLQLWGRCAVTGRLVPFPIVDLWIVPKLQFKIASVGIFEDAGVGFRTDDTVFRYRSYLHIRRSGIKIKVQKRKNIYILEAANPRNTAAPNSYLNLAAMP